MKPQRVDCCNCQNFQIDDGDGNDFKYFCKLGKRVMMRIFVNPHSVDFLFPRYCNDFKQTENV